MSDELFRYEINTRVRQILISYNIDMSKLSYSCIKKTIYLYGSLNKIPYGDFSIANIKSLVAELMHLPRIRDVQFDLENWIISTEAGEFNIIKGKRPMASPEPKD